MAAHVPPFGGERELLLGYLAHQRDLVRVQTYGLTDEQARQAPTASTLTVGGLVKHLASVERSWMGMVLQRPRPSMAEAGAAYVAGFRLGPDETLAGALDDYAQAARETDEVIAGIADLGQAVPVPKDMPWFPKDVDAWSVRWVLFHLIEETARHLGHADIIRESLDGATAIPLLAAVEGWPATDWIKPWQAPAAAAPTPA